MFDNIGNFFKRIMRTEQKQLTSKDAAKERLHLVLMQDRANVSVDFLELMKQEIIDVIKKYIEIDEKSIDVRLTNQSNDDGTNGAPALYANIPILNIKNDMNGNAIKEMKKEEKTEEVKAEIENEPKIKEKPQRKAETKKDEQTETESKVQDVEVKKEVEDVNEEKQDKVEVDENNKTEESTENKTLDDEVDDVPTFDELLKQSEEENKQTEEKPKKTTRKKSSKK